VSHAQPVQPPNQSFEIWQTYNGSIGNTYDEPVDWNTGNECSEILNQLAVTESSDAYSGASSARLETLPAFGNIKINGVLTTASMICSANSGGQEGGSPYTTEIPDSVVGFFKYAPMGSDSAYSQIMFLANNDMDTISYTRVNFTQAVGEWTRFSAALTPATGGQMPEKLSLLFSSSWGDGSQGEAVVGSVFYIDSVHFVSVPQGINDINRASNWSVYPNPVVGKLNVNGFTGETVNVEILDVTGKRVKYEKVKEEAATIDLSQLVAGIYLYQIKTLDQQVLRKGKLMVNP
jgi:hypothetical protein